MTTKVIAEYIWLGGKNEFRSKARTMEIKSADDLEIDNLPLWNYDGSSTAQAYGKNSEIILKPRAIFNDPFRRGNNVLVWCDTYDQDDSPLSNNHRASSSKIFNKYKKEKPWYGLEQEYFVINPATNKPLGFPADGYPEPQGQYYCAIGSKNIYGRKIADMHYNLCIMAGIKISGINAEVAPGQWEFQIGPSEGIAAGDHLWVARYLLERVAELSNVLISYHPKPVKGDWNGSGCHTNFSTESMRDGNGSMDGIDYIMEAIEKLEKNHDKHMKVYGEHNEERMTGEHETSSFDKFNYGMGNRGCSVRIPTNTINEKEGYFEDRRPSSNCDPYLVTSIILETVME